MPPLLKARRSREDGFDRGKVGWKALLRGARAVLGASAFLIQPHLFLTSAAGSEPSGRFSVETVEAELSPTTATAAAAAAAAASASCAAGIASAASTDTDTTTSRRQAARAFTFRTQPEAQPHGSNRFDGVDAQAATGLLEHCPFALEEGTPESTAFWRRTLEQAVVALGPLIDPTPGRLLRKRPRDSSAGSLSSTTRDVYDAINGLGTILACCPGVLRPSGSNSEADGGYDHTERSSAWLPSCGLLSIGTEEGMSRVAFPAQVGGGGGGNRSVGFELAMMNSRALRAARLPTQALQTLRDAYPLRQTPRQRSAWEAEAASVVLQVGKVGDATERLKTALGWDERDLGTLQLLGALLVSQGSVEEGFHYLRKAVEVQSDMIVDVFGDVAKAQGLDPSILDVKAHPREVLVTHRDWMALYLALVLEGRWKEIGDSVHVLRRVDNFLNRNLSMDSEISFMLGRELDKRGLEKESWDYLSNAAVPWTRQIYAVRAALSVPAVPSSQQDLDLAMSSLEVAVERLLPTADAARRGARGRQDEARPLSACFYGGLNYPDVALDHLPLLAFSDYRFRRKRHGFRRSDKRLAGDLRDGADLGNDRLGIGTRAGGVGDNDGVSPYGVIARLFSRLCPDLGSFVSPGLEAFAGRGGLAPKGFEGGRFEEEFEKREGRVGVMFVSSRFWNHGTTKTVAGLMRLLPRDFFEVTIASWMPPDDWTKEHVMPQDDPRPVNLVQNRTASLLRLAKRLPDVVVFVDASLDARTFLLSFGRVAPVQVALWGHAPTLGIPSIDYYVVPEALVGDAWQGKKSPTFEMDAREEVGEEDAVCPADSELDLPADDCYEDDDSLLGPRDAAGVQEVDDYDGGGEDCACDGGSRGGQAETRAGGGAGSETLEEFSCGARGREEGVLPAGRRTCDKCLETDAGGCTVTREPIWPSEKCELSGPGRATADAAQAVERGARIGWFGFPAAEAATVQGNFREPEDFGDTDLDDDDDNDEYEDNGDLGGLTPRGTAHPTVVGRRNVRRNGATGNDAGTGTEGGGRGRSRARVAGVHVKVHIKNIKKYITGPGEVIIGGKRISPLDELDEGDDDDDDDDDYDYDDKSGYGRDRRMAVPPVTITATTRRAPAKEAGVVALAAATATARSPLPPRDNPSPLKNDLEEGSSYHSAEEPEYCCCRTGERKEQAPPSRQRERTSPAPPAAFDDDDWPPPWAGVDYAGSVEEQVVFLEGLGAFVTPPGWEGKLGTGDLARAAGAAEVRRRHLLPQESRLAVLPIPVYHFHPEFDEVIEMLIDRHPLIHVVVAVEETSAEESGAELEFFRHDVLQHAFPPLWTEKLRSRLERRLGDDVWRLHLLPPLDSWDYFALLGAADVVLDPFPVGNLHAAVDAFALGTPVVTLPSRQRAGARFVQALASDLELPASICAAKDVEHYVDLVARLCLDQAWAFEVAAVLDYYARDWVYIHPDASGASRSGGEGAQPPPPLEGSGGEGEAEYPCGGSTKREYSAWVRGEDHVNDWAEFLWRVSRPGVFVDFSGD